MRDQVNKNWIQLYCNEKNNLFPLIKQEIDLLNAKNINPGKTIQIAQNLHKNYTKNEESAKKSRGRLAAPEKRLNPLIYA